MKIIIALQFLLLQILTAAITAESLPPEASTSDLAPLLLIEAKIYKLDNNYLDADFNTQIKHATLESSPSLLAYANKEASIRIGSEESSGQSTNMLMIDVISNEDVTFYKLDFHLLDGEFKYISSIDNATVGSVLNLSATINNISRLITIKTTKQTRD